MSWFSKRDTTVMNVYTELEFEGYDLEKDEIYVRVKARLNDREKMQWRREKVKKGSSLIVDQPLEVALV
jgi:hypothetical protein